MSSNTLSTYKIERCIIFCELLLTFLNYLHYCIYLINKYLQMQENQGTTAVRMLDNNLLQTRIPCNFIVRAAL